MQKKRTKRLVPAVDRAARILAVMAGETRPMSITALALHLKASKGTIRDILETLRDHGFLDRDEATKLYRLGPQLVRLGTSSSGSTLRSWPQGREPVWTVCNRCSVSIH